MERLRQEKETKFEKKKKNVVSENEGTSMNRW